MPGAGAAHTCEGNAVVPASKATGHCICVAESVSTCSWRTTALQSEPAVETAPGGPRPRRPPSRTGIRCGSVLARGTSEGKDGGKVDRGGQHCHFCRFAIFHRRVSARGPELKRVCWCCRRQ